MKNIREQVYYKVWFRVYNSMAKATYQINLVAKFWKGRKVYSCVSREILKGEAI